MEGLPSIDVSNVLSEEKRQQVIALGRLGWPLRRIQQEMLAAAGEGAILAGQAEPHRECSMAVNGDRVAW